MKDPIATSLHFSFEVCETMFISVLGVLVLYCKESYPHFTVPLINVTECEGAHRTGILKTWRNMGSQFFSLLTGV